MLPFAPPGLVGEPAELLFQFLVRFWMPYLFIRAMAREARPALPNLGFVFFAGLVLLFGLIEGALIAAAHALVLRGGASPEDMYRLVFAAEIAATALTLRLLPLYAGTATGRLSPLERNWWAGLRGAASLALFAALVIVSGGASLLERLLTAPVSAFELQAIALLHLQQLVVAAAFLFSGALALAACNRCANLPPPEASR